MGHHSHGAERRKRLQRVEHFLGSERGTESAFVAAVNQRAAERGPREDDGKARRRRRRPRRKLLTAAKVLLPLAAIAAAVLLVWPHPGDRAPVSDLAAVAPAAGEDGGASGAAEGVRIDIVMEPKDTAPGDGASAPEPQPATTMADTGSDVGGAEAAVWEGLPPLPGVKPDPG